MNDLAREKAGTNPRPGRKTIKSDQGKLLCFTVILGEKPKYANTVNQRAEPLDYRAMLTLLKKPV
jgi:hypothetical protein